MLQLLAIFIEVMIVVIALAVATEKKQTYGYGLALTFAIYVIYDSIRQFQISLPPLLPDALFLIASLSALWSVWKIYQSQGK